MKRSFTSINWQGMIDDGSYGGQTPDQAPSPWAPQQPSQLYPFYPPRSKRVDNSNQPWYGSKNRSFLRGPAERDTEQSVKASGITGPAPAAIPVNSLTQQPVTGQPIQSLSGIWTSLASFFNSLSNHSLGVTNAPVNNQNQNALPVDQTQWAIQSAQGQGNITDTSNITNAG